MGRSGVRMIKNDYMTYEKFLPGQQKKRLITLLMEQMRMLRISSSVKYLVPMTYILQRVSGGEMEKGLRRSSIRWRPSMNSTSESALPKHAHVRSGALT